ncbi:MAG: hypothetical protein IPF87_07380 [Gemmatimonadetes bacterium]|nr:hypothetical protein [Gemmatimonadota bacterium]
MASFLRFTLMRPLPPLGDSARATRLFACSVVALAACAGAETSAPTLDAQRTLAALQLESSAALPTSLNERAHDSNVSWIPPIDANELRLLVPAQVIDVRDTVRAGQSVPIIVNTIGENGCWQSDGGSLTQRGDSAFIAAFDRHSGAQVCTMLWTDRLVHSFTTVFPKAGVGVIRVNGRRIKDAKPAYSLPVTAERTVVVIP